MPLSQPNFLADQNKKDQRFEALFQNASLGMLVANEQGDIVLVNNFMVSAFGYYDANELIGKKVELLIPSRFHHRYVSDRENSNKNPERRPMGTGRDLFGVKKTGKEFPVKISLSSYINDKGFFVIGFVSDNRQPSCYKTYCPCFGGYGTSCNCTGKSKDAKNTWRWIHSWLIK